MLRIYVQRKHLSSKNKGSDICTQYMVDPLQSVLQLKAEIEEIEGLSVERQCLRFEGKELKNEDTLEGRSLCQNQNSLISLVDLWTIYHQVDGMFREGPVFKSVKYRALCDWDGNMKHASTAGLALVKGMEVDIPCHTISEDNWWFVRLPDSYAWISRVRLPDDYAWVPRTYLREASSTDVKDTDIPSIPAFDFPLAKPLQFKVSLGERGHSYVQVTLKYEVVARPGEPTFVDVALDCVSTAERCITSVSLKVVAPGLTMGGVCFPDATTLGSPKSVNVETTSALTSDHHGDLNFTIPHTPLGGTAGGSKQTEQTKKESGTRESQPSIEGVVSGVDTAHWVIEGRRGVGERERVPKILGSISFVLQEKPTDFEYEFYVTTTKRGQKPKEHSSVSKSLFSKMKETAGF
ncbi:hypothetical protein R3P38DRAFT_3044191 [Favolaschia claudopus]|uniref:Ubiquitin-like domain-containing protein n=1 Tax=Favolaschia claudopus TaxID=2862362 RepID=A0AAW0A683_9AGAR